MCFLLNGKMFGNRCSQTKPSNKSYYYFSEGGRVVNSFRPFVNKNRYIILCQYVFIDFAFFTLSMGASSWRTLFTFWCYCVAKLSERKTKNPLKYLLIWCIFASESDHSEADRSEHTEAIRLSFAAVSLTPRTTRACSLSRKSLILLAFLIFRFHRFIEGKKLLEI